ncbi:MAG: hypothetical protein ACI92O_000327 [Colwellia sp.]|jgi:hypothetical protein
MQNTVLSHVSNMEIFAVKLFPKHSSFFSLNTKDCNILTYLNNRCLNNHLNWLGVKQWPNDNANEFINYKTYTETTHKFISRMSNVKGAFLFVDLFENTPSNAINSILLDLTERCRKPSMLVYNSKESIDVALQASLDNWTLEKYKLVDVENDINIIVLLNYADNNSQILYPGSNASNRQRINRKGARWEKLFSELIDVEKDYILMKLISYYLRSK